MLVGEHQLRAAPMIEFAILIVMAIFAIGFAWWWWWFIEQKKKRKGSTSAKGDRAIARKPHSNGIVQPGAAVSELMVSSHSGRRTSAAGI
jgi:peptidoglycan/LPS O-acetylase OafA/YrhL